MDVIANCLCLKFRMLSRATAVLYDGVLQPADLSSSQFSVLRNIHRFEPSGVAKLANVMLTERTTLTRNLDLLSERGFVEFEQPKNDQRVYKPVLTSAGRAKLKYAIPHWRKAQRRILGGLGAHGWEHLQHTLRSAAAICEEGPEVAEDLLEEDLRRTSVAQTDRFDPATIRRCVNSTLRGASRVVTREYDSALRDGDLKITQLHVLSAIAENPGTRVSDVSALLLIDQTTATLSIAAARRHGWIRTASKVEPGLYPSKEGEARLRKAIPKWTQCQKDKVRGHGNSPTQWTLALDRTLAAALKANAS